MRTARLLRRVWNSPTITSWCAISVRLLGLVFLLPLMLTRFEAAEIAVWYLFSTVLSFQIFLEVGFTPTFQRVIAYAMAGATTEQLDVDDRTGLGGAATSPNWATMRAIVSTTRVIYARIAVAALLVLGFVGSGFLFRPISQCQDTASAWSAWAILLLTTAVAIYGITFSCYLVGTNHVAAMERRNAVIGLFGIASDFGVLLLGGGLLGLVVSKQVWHLLGIGVDRWMCRNVLERRYAAFHGRRINKSVLRAVWPASWRSVLGQSLGKGLLSVSSLMLAQRLPTQDLANYLFGLRLTETINGLAIAPFYSKLPVLSRLRKSGSVIQLVSTAQRGMLISYATFILGMLVLGLFGEFIANTSGSNAAFPNPLLWTLLGGAFFLQRTGAMHLQLYSTTNHIIWHKVTFAYSLVFLSGLFCLLPIIGVYAVPVSMIIGYAGFYVPKSMKHSYDSVDSSFWIFERRTFLPMAAMFAFSVAIVLVIDL